jgi:tryptophan-rich sensory protein
LQLTHNPIKPYLAIAVASILAIICNSLIAVTGVGNSRPDEIVPSSWAWVDQIVGFVWVGLLAGLGASWWLLKSRPAPDSAERAKQVVILAAVCLLYPFTFGLRPESGLVGNILIAIFAATVTSKTYRASRAAALLIVPVILWLSIAAIYLIVLLKANTH